MIGAVCATPPLAVCQAAWTKFGPAIAKAMNSMPRLPSASRVQLVPAVRQRIAAFGNGRCRAYEPGMKSSDMLAPRNRSARRSRIVHHVERALRANAHLTNPEATRPVRSIGTIRAVTRQSHHVRFRGWGRVANMV